MEKIKKEVLKEVSEFLRKLSVPFVKLEISGEAVFANYTNSNLESLIRIPECQHRFSEHVLKNGRKKQTELLGGYFGLFYDFLFIKEIDAVITLGGYRTIEGRENEKKFEAIHFNKLSQIPLQKRNLVKQKFQILKQKILDYIAQSEKIFCYQIVQYLHQNLEKRITVVDLANKFHCSDKKIRATFRKHICVSFRAYSLSLKMSHAKKRLAEGELTVEEIAHSLGYTNRQGFTNAHKMYFGYSPKKAKVDFKN